MTNMRWGCVIYDVQVMTMEETWGQDSAEGTEFLISVLAVARAEESKDLRQGAAA
jgi:hypothetical protein